MNVTITTNQVEWSKGWFYNNWSLMVNGKEFILGQDAKWTIRLLGLQIEDFFEMIGTDDRTESGREKIGKWIVKEFKLTPKKVEKMEQWSLCCQ
jgi:hypothetical protein